MKNEQVLKLTKMDLLGSAGVATAVTALIVFLSSALV
ncbi:DUF3948 family protein [Bacillus sp. DX1.1]|nr:MULTISPECIES: DUF3948 family protein [unclassified Bacillus (in: firmicutes)]MDM5153037.1 DUF3948 family protein [Bacillus sp. DX1.1]WJE82012.1 DUF3948 family protein [Bacillus sp. DX3.1]